MKVYFADVLKNRYPEVFYPAKLNLEANGIIVDTIKGTKNIWCRDYMPIKIGPDKYVKFGYKTVGYRKFKQLQVATKIWYGIYHNTIHREDIVLDGGTVVAGHNIVFATDIIFNQNPTWERNKLIGEIEELFQSKLILLPIEPDDTLGHADGIIQFINHRTVLINDYSSVFKKNCWYRNYIASLTSILCRAGFDIEVLPYGYGEWDWSLTEKQFRKQFPQADDFNPAFGYYINFLRIDGLILCPVMKIEKDKEVLEILKKYFPASNIVAIDCSKLSMEGGLIHCVTWEE